MAQIEPKKIIPPILGPEFVAAAAPRVEKRRALRDKRVKPCISYFYPFVSLVSTNQECDVHSSQTHRYARTYEHYQQLILSVRREPRRFRFQDLLVPGAIHYIEAPPTEDSGKPNCSPETLTSTTCVQ